MIFGVLNEEKSKKTLKHFGYNNYVINDTILGWRFRPNCTEERSTCIIYGGDTVYDVYYSSDEFCRRISKKNVFIDSVRDNSIIKKHAIFLGCSYTFGQGLNIGSTFPFLFESMHPDYKSYNYGFSNYGPQEFCLFFDEGINTINDNTVAEDSGFCLYTFLDDHLNRVYGGSTYLSNINTKYSPDVYVYDNKLVCKKRSNIQIYTSLFLNISETMKFFNINFTYPKTIVFYRRFAEIINYTAHKYWDIKPHGEFYVGLYPMKYYVTDTSWIRFLDNKIKVLNIPYPNDFETNSNYTIKNDGHPAKELNLYYVKEISKLIFKKKYSTLKRDS